MINVQDDNLKYFVLGDTIMVTLKEGETPHTITRGTHNEVLYDEVLTALQNNETDKVKALLLSMSDKIKATLSGTNGALSLNKYGEVVDAGGNTLDNYAVNYVKAFATNGVGAEPFLKFMERLRKNPSNRAQEELAKWMEAGGMSITPDGFLLAYKRVRSDYKSIHDGKTDNTVGNYVEMPRSAVDDNFTRTCSHGLHFCSADYLPAFGNGGLKSTTDRILLLKIDPADVVSIPNDYNNTKGRACRYLILKDVTEDFVDAINAGLTSPSQFNVDTNPVFSTILFSMLTPVSEDDEDEEEDEENDSLD